jgi:hypothetical protein
MWLVVLQIMNFIMPTAALNTAPVSHLVKPQFIQKKEGKNSHMCYHHFREPDMCHLKSSLGLSWQFT